MIPTVENTYSGRKKETFRDRSEQMTEHMTDISREINQEMKKEYGVDDFLSPDGSIDMNSYARRNGFTEEEVKRDEQEIVEREESWLGSSDKKNKKRKLDKNEKMELIAMSVLFKILKKEFVVVHSSIYDDYKNGVDNILVNKKTGDVICAFDELHHFVGNPRYDNKIKKIKRIARTGENGIKYGFTFKNGKILEKSMDNLPVFLLSLKTVELEEAEAGVSLDAKSQPNETELQIMEKFIANLHNQLDIIRSSVNPLIRNNLAKFEKYLQRIEEITAEHRSRLGN